MNPYEVSLDKYNEYESEVNDNYELLDNSKMYYFLLLKPETFTRTYMIFYYNIFEDYYLSINVQRKFYLK